MAALRHAVPLAWRRRLAVLVGGMLGGGARIAVSSALNGTAAVPWGTFAANVSGAVVLGYLLTRALHAAESTSLTVPLLATGVLGSYTTFSTFSLEVWQLLEHDRTGVALGYALASLLLGLAGAATGMRVADQAR